MKKIIVTAIVAVMGLMAGMAQAAETGQGNNEIILHAWSWSFNTIREHLSEIKAAGYTIVQTSPINECVVGEGGGRQLFGNGKWYYFYQPTDYTIGNYILGSEDEFKALCNEAHQYGIKIIVDVVLNHCTSNYNAISQNVKNITSQTFFISLPSCPCACVRDASELPYQAY